MPTISTDYAVNLDLVIVRGMTTDNVIFTFADTNNNPIDVTSWLFHWQMKDANGNVLLDATVANGHMTNGGTAGTATLVFDSATTWGLTDTTSALTPPTHALVVTIGSTRHLSHAGNVYVTTPTVGYP
jgi:hypothetical protein